jgi:hypothetical protein
MVFIVGARLRQLVEKPDHCQDGCEGGRFGVWDDS